MFPSHKIKYFLNIQLGMRDMDVTYFVIASI